MSTRSYRVIHTGKLLDGFTPSRTAETLKNDFCAEQKWIDAFLSGKRFTVKKSLSVKQAAKIRSKLRMAGLDAQVLGSTPHKSQDSYTPLQDNTPAHIESDNASQASEKAPNKQLVTLASCSFVVAIVILFLATSPVLDHYFYQRNDAPEPEFLATSLPEPEKNTTNSNKLFSEDGEASLQLPESWAAMQALNDTAILQAGNLRKETYLIVIRESKTSSSSANFAAFYKQAEQSFPADSISRHAHSTIGELPAFQFSARGFAEGIEINYRMVAVEGSLHYYKILAWGLYDQYNQDNPVFSEIINSFRAP